MLTIMVTGSHSLTAAEREWTEKTIFDILRRYHPAETKLIHGYAYGVDRAAQAAAERIKYARIEGFHADWDGPYKKGAGFIRNADMMRELNQSRERGNDTLVVALFAKGHITNGTKDSCQRAVSSGHRLEVYGLFDWYGQRLLRELASKLDFELDAGSILIVPRRTIKASP